jgi:uncharacterized protein YjaG (DUF416 family)
MTFKFDHETLAKKLLAIPSPQRVLFAAATAERLFPKIVDFFQTDRPDMSEKLRSALDLVWAVGGGDAVDIMKRDSALGECMTAIQTAAADGSDQAFFAENAAASIAYGLRAIGSDDPKEPAWAAQVAYDTVDRYAMMEERELDIEWTEEQILAHPVVQRELERQLKCINMLEALVGSSVKEDVVKLRKITEQQALSVFEHV